MPPKRRNMTVNERQWFLQQILASKITLFGQHGALASKIAWVHTLFGKSVAKLHSIRVTMGGYGGTPPPPQIFDARRVFSGQISQNFLSFGPNWSFIPHTLASIPIPQC